MFKTKLQLTTNGSLEKHTNILQKPLAMLQEYRQHLDD